MSNFITNSGEKNLKRRIQTLVERSEELKFLVGFFYFSGLRELYESLKKLYNEGKLKDEHLKILVGLNVDEGNYGLYEIAKIEKTFSNNKIKEKFLESLKVAFTSCDLDNKDVYEQVDLFLSLLKEKKIKLRKTSEPNHAKLYLFKMDNSVKEVIPNLFITGSSNLTKAGLESQREFNVEVKDYGFEEAERYFDELWNEAVEFSEEDINKIVKIIKEESLLRKISPFVAYAYLVYTYLNLHKRKISKNFESILKDKGYKPFSYQLEAVSQALANCNAHNGTILADVVGLGKTIIACLVAKSLGKRGIVICPPHLIGDENRTSGWRKYLDDFELRDWEVRSIGKLRDTLKFVKKNNDIEVVIVDEAHRFRNENTQSYYYLREICRGKTVILITATPFNNRPSDLFALLKLFTIPRKSTIILDENLEAKFLFYETEFRKLAYIKNYFNSKNEKKKKKAKRYYKEIFGGDNINLDKVRVYTKELAKEIRAILEPIVIRRNRLDLKYYGEKIDLPEVKDPQEWFFELTKEQSLFYDEVIQTFASHYDGGKFTGAIYFPARYEKDIDIEALVDEFKDNKEYFAYVSQQNLYDFMRRLLVKRFESSFGAFKESIHRFRDIHETAIEFVEKTGKFILDRKLMEDLVIAEPEEILKELAEYEKDLKEKNISKKYYKVYDIKKDLKYAEKFVEDLKEDLKLFERIYEEVEKLKLVENDPKAERLIKGLEEFLKEGRKVVIFTEYLDTADYLKEILKNKFKDRLLTAIGNLSKSTIEAILKNFDAQYEDQESKYDVLLTTDKLSEGFNLNRAGVVINYDIPWNPVRVIQRVGRINRIAKKVYNEIYIVNFFPTEKGSDIVKSREIAQTKMFMIHNVLGEDAKIFDPDEEPQPSELYRRLNTYIEEEESFFTKLRRDFEKIKEIYPNIENEIQNIPNRVKVAKKGEEDELLVFVKKGKDLFVGYKNYKDKSPQAVSFEKVYEKIKAEKDEEGLNLSDHFWENYHQILEKEDFIKPRCESSNDSWAKAYSILTTLIENKDEKLNPYKKFISDILEDIREYRTLSEYVISEINSLSEKLDDIDKIVEKLSELKSEIGEDFLEKTLKFFKNHREEIIIAIENRNKI
ncbi:MAG: helicase-related protein [Dictyoglomus turgidum]